MSLSSTAHELLSLVQDLRVKLRSDRGHRRSRTCASVSRQSDVFELRALLAATVTLNAAAGSVSENGGSTTLTATLSEPATEDVFVYLQTNGSAVNNTDYQITSGAAPIAIDGDFSDWTNNPAILFGNDPLNDTHDTNTSGAGNSPLYVNHPDVDLRAFGVTHDNENLYFYFRSEGEIGRTQIADAAQGKIAGRYYVIVTMDVDQNDTTGYPLHEGGYYPTTPGYDMNSEIEFYGGTFNTGNYLNHGATDPASLNQAFADQSNGGYVPAQAAQDIQGPFTPGFVRVLPGTYSYYTQWVYKENDPANSGNDSVTFVKDKGPIVTGNIQQAVSADGHELEMIVPYKGFLVDQNGDPIVDVGSILDLSFSLEASGELAPGNEWASDTANPLNGYALTASDELPVSVIRIPKGQTSADVRLTAMNNSVVSPGRSAVVEIASVVGAVPNGTQQISVNILNDDSPSIQTSLGNVSYVVGSPAVAVDPGLTSVATSGSTYTGASVSVGSGYVAGDDILEYVAEAGIAGNFDSALGILTFTGDATPAAYQSVLRSVTYRNAGGKPAQAERTVTFTVNSGALSERDTRVIQLSTVELVNVDVLADRISEAGGSGATLVRVSRTDTDGPFTVPMTQNFSNPATWEIPDNRAIYSPIVVPTQASGITDLDVTVDFEHAWLGDLDVFLISPNGTRVELFTDLLSTGTRMTGTILDDQANLSILNGAAPFSGRFTPEGSLSSFNMESPAGTWLLEVIDDNISHAGRLLGWSMTINTMGLQAATVVLKSSDIHKAAFQNNATRTVVIPENQSEVFVPLDAVDNNILDGDTIVAISAISVDVTGLGLGSDTVVVTDKETLAFTISSSPVSEAVLPPTITGTLTRQNTNVSLPYTVMISSSNPGKLSVVPAFVTIPANQSAIEFPIQVHDNSTVDGDMTVTLTATAAEYGSPVTVDVIVLDYEPALRLSATTTNVAEDGGAFDVKVTRQGITASDLSNALTVNLSALPGLVVPATVVIPAGMSDATFSVGIVDNNLLDGTRLTGITASKNLYTTGNLDVSITDYEFVSITVDKSSFLENAGAEAATGTIRRSDTDNLSQALLVALETSDATELMVPATVTIPAGQASITFSIAAVDDADVDGTKSVVITASSSNYHPGSVAISVLDHEPPVLTGPAATTTNPRPTITWNPVPGAIRYDVWVNSLTTGVSQLLRNINVTGNSYVPPENLGIGRYRVWVRAIDQLEQPGFWSTGRDFFVNTPATITAPKQGTAVVDSKFPTIVWSAIPDATKYEVWVNNITSTPVQVVNRTGANALGTTSYTPTEVLGSGTYKIWVRGLNSKNEAGLWSDPVIYRVVAAPTITQPTVENTFDRTPTFAWTGTTGATNYDVWISDKKTGIIVFRDKFVRTTSFTATKDMAFGEYRIWVRAQNADSFSAWSLAKTFSVGLAPKITSVKTVGTPARQQFSWTGVGGTERYELWVNNMATNARVIHQTNLTTTTYLSQTTLPPGTYRVWVRAVSTMGEITNWSSPLDFVVALSVKPTPPATPVESAIPVSLIFSDVRVTSDNLPAAQPDVPRSERDEPVRFEDRPVTESELTDSARAVNPIDAVLTSTADNDAVMSELPLAEWWAEASDAPNRGEHHSEVAIVASAGPALRRIPDGRRNQNRK